MNNFQNIPQELKTLPQWICWKYTLVKGELKKVPMIPGTNRRASSTDPKKWRSFDEALKAAQTGNYDGIGFVFKDGGGYVGIDIDDCVINSELSDKAKEIIAMIDSYTEYSTSGSGVHIICRADELRNGINGKRNDPQGLEIYRSGRYFVMTGNALSPAKPINERQDAVYQFMDKYFPAEEERPQVVKQDVTTLPPTVNVSDADLIEKIRESKQGGKFSMLFDRGDYSEYSNADGSANHSGGDMALAEMIAWWTQDAEQIRRIFSASALAQRQKWQRRDYQDRTINEAIKRASARSSSYNPTEYAKQMEEKRTAELIAGLTAGDPTDADAADREQLLKEILFYELSEAGNAERMQRICGDTWLYVGNNNSWFKWDGKRWSENNGSELTSIAIKLFRLLKKKSKELFKEDE